MTTSRGSPLSVADYFGRVSRHRPTWVEVANELKALAVAGDEYAADLAGRIERGVERFAATLTDVSEGAAKAARLARNGHLDFCIGASSEALDELTKLNTLRATGAEYISLAARKAAA